MSFLKGGETDNSFIKKKDAQIETANVEVANVTTLFVDTAEVSGSLTVQGTTTTIESTILTIDDKNIELGSVPTPTDATADQGGIILKGTTDKTIIYDQFQDHWIFNPGIQFNYLEDVHVAGATDGDVLTWNSTTGQWEAKPTQGTSTLPPLSFLTTAIGIAEIIVKVDLKTSNHPYTGQGSTHGYYFEISGLDYESPYLDVVAGQTYKFNQDDSTNAGHPIRFYKDAARTIPYTTGVTNYGTPGSIGGYTEIAIEETSPPILYYQCNQHGFMGNQLQVKGALHSIENLQKVDVTTVAPTAGQVLKWDGTNWIPDTLSVSSIILYLDDISDVITSGVNTPSQGQVLMWDSGAGGTGSWIPFSITSITTIQGLTDVSSTPPSAPSPPYTARDILTWDSGNTEWSPRREGSGLKLQELSNSKMFPWINSSAGHTYKTGVAGIGQTDANGNVLLGVSLANAYNPSGFEELNQRNTPGYIFAVCWSSNGTSFDGFGVFSWVHADGYGCRAKHIYGGVPSGNGIMVVVGVMPQNDSVLKYYIDPTGGEYFYPHSGAVSGAVTIEDEGQALTTEATNINFTGSGVTATGTGSTKTVNIPGLVFGNTASRLTVHVADGQTVLWQTGVSHISGNIDVILNGIFLIPQITSIFDTTGANNLPAGEYDFQSGEYISGSFSPRNADVSCNYVRLMFTPELGDKLMLRIY